MSLNKESSARQEHMIADYLGWKVTSGSGARPTVVGDVYSDSWVGECKTHNSSGNKIKFDVDVWDKIKSEAASKFKYPVLFVDDGSQKSSTTWCLFRRSLFYSFHVATNFPFKVRKHIIFEHSLLEKAYRNISESGPVLFEIDINGDELAICRLSDFADMFRG